MYASLMYVCNVFSLYFIMCVYIHIYIYLQGAHCND